MALLPVDQALSQLLEGIEAKPAISVGLHAAAGRTLACDISALRTQPPFDASAMDGYAVRSQDAMLGTRLYVIGESAAGRAFSGTLGEGETVRIFTGAPMPAGADAVVIQEDTIANGDQIAVTESAIAGRHIRRRGLDFGEGDLLLEAGRVLDPAAVSLAAAANHPTLPVVGRPLVAVIATGDELLPPGSTPGPDQIISSNCYGVAAILREAGAEILDLGIAPDRKDAIRSLIDTARDAGADIIVTLGGASVGDHDLVHAVLADAGMSLAFWKIAMRPGKPLMFGRLGSIRCVGLPGNPVASLLCAELFVRPMVARMAQKPIVNEEREAALTVDIVANDHRQDYMRAAAEPHDDGTWSVTPFKTQDSSMLRSLAASNCVLVRPPNDPQRKAGERVRILMLR
jgi:molybdopterin molybdotransferase